MVCLNKKNPEYQTLLRMSGIQEETLEDYCNYFLEEYDRFPRLDELPGVDSKPYIEETYDIKDNVVDTIKLSESLQTSDTGEQIHKLNGIYHDKLIDIEPITDTTANIEILPRPTDNFEEFFPQDYDNVQVNVINGILEDIARYSGLNFKTTNTYEMRNMQDIPNAGITGAFIKDGTIYVNTELLTADSPTHEMLHIFLGGIKFTSPELYNNLLQTVSQLDSYKVYANNYSNRTASDIAEEVLVTEFGKYVTHQASMFDIINKKQTEEVMYHVKRIIDTALFGEVSVKALTDEELFSKPLIDVAKSINSDVVRNNFLEVWNFSRQHRQLNNLKASLMRAGTLKEFC